MSKLAKELFDSIATMVRQARGQRRPAQPGQAIAHDPNVRAGGNGSNALQAGLFGVLVSNDNSRF